MRQILVRYARDRRAEKRGGGQHQCTLEDFHAVADGRPVDLLDLDRARTELARLDPEQAQIVEMRFFGGLSMEESAEALSISPATVKPVTARFTLCALLNDCDLWLRRMLKL